VGAFEAKMTSKGQVTLPANLRSAMRLQAGDKIVFTAEADGTFRLAAKNGSLRDLRGVIDTGPRVSKSNISDWIEAARGRSAPASLGKRRVRRSTP